MMFKRNSRPDLESGRIQYVRPERIRLDASRPARVFDPVELQQLAESLRRSGMLQPLTVCRVGDTLQLVAGERRLRAARLAGLREVPCVLVTEEELRSGVPALVEQLRRRDLSYLEEARGLARLMEYYGLTQEQAAQQLGKSQSAVANKLRILRHPAPVLEALQTSGLSERHARALLRLPESQRQEAIAEIARGGWTVAQTEQYIDSVLAGSRKSPRYLFRDVGLFLNSLDRSLAMIRSAGINCDATRQETEGEIVLTIRLPKSPAGVH